MSQQIFNPGDTAPTVRGKLNANASEVQAHMDGLDPHPQYQLESEKGVADGYASLGSDGKVPTAQLPATMTPSAHAASHASGGGDPIITALDARAYPTAGGLLSARPTAGTAGRLYFATDTALLYRDNGATWDTVMANDDGFTLTADVGSPMTILDALTVQGRGPVSTENSAADTLDVFLVADTLLGPPSSGTYADKDLHLDAAGALWEYREGAYVVTGWYQRTVGIVAAEPVAGDFDGGVILTDYIWRLASTGQVWMYDGAAHVLVNEPYGTMAAHLAASDPHTQYVQTTGDETVAGVKTFSSAPVLSPLTASRLLATGAGKAAESVTDLAAWIAGTANRVTVTSDGDGTITLSGPQDIHTGASPTFAGLTLGGKVVTSSVSAPGSPAAGDLWYDTTLQVLWTWSTTYSRWMSLFAEQVQLGYWGTVTYPISTSVTLGLLPLSTSFDWVVHDIVWAADGNSGTWDASNKWTLRPKQGATGMVDIDKVTSGYSTLSGAPTSAALALFDTTSHRTVQVDLIKSGSPGSLNCSVVSLLVRKAHT